MDALILYSRPDCHLCEVAADLLTEVAPGQAFETVNIEHSVDLLARYGWHIPVLARQPGGQELRWPFDAEALGEFLAPG